MALKAPLVSSAQGLLLHLLTHRDGSKGTPGVFLKAGVFPILFQVRSGKTFFLFSHSLAPLWVWFCCNGIPFQYLRCFEARVTEEAEEAPNLKDSKKSKLGHFF